jgi:hypothetical protein
METPNTRYRRKRGDEETFGGTPRASGSGSGTQGSGSQEDRVIWVHDQRLRRAVQMATEHGTYLSPISLSNVDDLVELAPPTPTQKPRSICSRPTTSTSTSSRPPRKRPCRPSRSVPTSGSGSIRPEAGSSSAPSATGRGRGGGEEVKLELLLQQFELLSAPPVPSASTSAVTPAGKGKGRNLDRRDLESPITRSSSTRTRASPQIHIDAQAQVQVQGPTTKSPKPDCTSRSIAPSPLSIKQTNTASTRPTTTIQSRPKSHPKPFKTPFLLDPKTRSSPRRTTIPPSPLRAPPLETPLRRGVIRKHHNANVDIGEDEPEGNDSFDSFDGMFQEGGPEVEELFRRIDGS